MGQDGGREASKSWVAIAAGALDIAGRSDFDDGTEILVLSAVPSGPLALRAVGASVWKRLLEGPVLDGDLSEDEHQIVLEMADAGLASQDNNHPWRMTSVTKPWLESPLHELVYALVHRVGTGAGIDVVFIKGPVLERQGLRRRRNSADADVLVDDEKIPVLIDALRPWGWYALPDVWEGTIVNHSLTLAPSDSWACQIDVHRRMPGIGLSDQAAFTAVREAAQPVEFAGVAVMAPDSGMHAVLLALHTMRPEIGMQKSQGHSDMAVAALRAGGAAALDAVRKIDAMRALQGVLAEAFPDERIDLRRSREPRDWQWRAQQSKARAYRVALKDVPWRHKFVVAFRLIWPKSEAVELSDDWAGEHSRSTGRARLKRLQRGLQGLLRPKR